MKKKYYTEAELRWIKSTFKSDDDFALKTLRKIFAPRYEEGAEVGQAVNMYMAVQTEDRKVEDIALDVKAINRLMTHVENQLQVLKIIATQEDETEENKAARLKKESAE